jgi:AmiR/NasT family two-component response regulator
VVPRADDSRDEAVSLGDRSSALNDARRRIQHLETALQTNRRIGVAIGILMSRYAVPEEEAFAMLAEASQRSNRKLREIADEVAYEGDLPRWGQSERTDDSDADLDAVG